MNKIAPLNSSSFVKFVISSLFGLICIVVFAQDSTKQYQNDSLEDKAENSSPTLDRTLTDSIIQFETDSLSKETNLTSPEKDSLQLKNNPTDTTFVHFLTIIKHVFESYIVITLSYLMFCIVIFIFKPVHLLKIYDILSKENVVLTKLLFFNFITSFFLNRNRVIDSWGHNEKVVFHSNYIEMPMFKERLNHVYLPIKFNDNITYNAHDIDSLKEKMLKAIQKSDISIQFIGIGGSGKTSLLCQFVLHIFNMNKHKNNYPIIPIIFKPGFNSDIITYCIETIYRITKSFKLSEEFISNAIKKGRIILIADSFSEFNQDEKRRFLEPNVVFKNLIISTRTLQKELDKKKNIKVNLEPINTGENRIYFITQYFTMKKQPFTDNSYDILLKKLTQIIGAKSVTPAMLKLFCEHSIKIYKNNPQALKMLPSTFPNLLKEYVISLYNSINMVKINISNQNVLDGLKLISYFSLDNFKPSGTTTEKMNIELKERMGWDFEKCNNFYNALFESGIILREGIYINLWIDPASEYFGAMYIAEKYHTKKNDWETFLNNLINDKIVDSCLGFILGLFDVVSSSMTIKYPKEIINQLSLMSGRGIPENKRIVNQIIKDIFDPEQEIRGRAPFKLLEFDDFGKLSISQILETAKDFDDYENWHFALNAIRSLGYFAEDYTDELIKLLSFEDEKLVISVIRTLRSIDKQGRSLDSLISLFSDKSPRIRSEALKSVREIGCNQVTSKVIHKRFEDDLLLLDWRDSEYLHFITGDLRIINAVSFLFDDKVIEIQKQSIKTAFFYLKRYLESITDSNIDTPISNSIIDSTGNLFNNLIDRLRFLNRIQNKDLSISIEYELGELITFISFLIERIGSNPIDKNLFRLIAYLSNGLMKLLKEYINLVKIKSYYSRKNCLLLSLSILKSNMTLMSIYSVNNEFKDNRMDFFKESSDNLLALIEAIAQESNSFVKNKVLNELKQINTDLLKHEKLDK